MINKKTFIYALLFGVIFINTPLAIAVDSKPVSTLQFHGWLEQQMSLECNGRPMKEVLENIAAFFQTEIVYEAEGADLSTQCHYSMATVEQILDRLFRKQNRAILIEEVPKRRITVQRFGVSKYILVSNDGSSTSQMLPFLATMTNEALANLQREQLKTYRAELKDLNAIIPGVGLTRAEISKLHKQQIQQLKHSQNDPNQIVAGTAMTQQQLKVVQEQQLKEYELVKQDQVDPFTGLTLGEITELHQQQLRQ